MYLPQCLLVAVFLYSCGAVETTEKTPDLLTMLETVKGGGDVSKFFSYLNDMKVARKGLSMLENVSPLMKSIWGKAAKRNPKLNILLKVMTGHMPDLHDIYQFLTTKSGSIVSVMAAAQANNPEFNQMESLVHSQRGHPTLRGMTQLAEIIFGKTFNFKEVTLHKIAKGNVTDLTVDEIPEFNMLEMMLAFVDNYDDVIVNVVEYMEQGESGFSQMYNALGKMDRTHFERIQALPKVFKDGKYQVGKHGDTQQDPDVHRFLSDLSSGTSLKSDDPNYANKAEALLLDAIASIFHLVTDIIQQSALIDEVTKSTPSNVNAFG